MYQNAEGKMKIMSFKKARKQKDKVFKEKLSYYYSFLK